MPVTTIKISMETKSRLDKLKEYKKESYEEIMQKIFLIINILKVNPVKARKILKRIEFEKLAEIKEKEYEEKMLKKVSNPGQKSEEQKRLLDARDKIKEPFSFSKKNQGLGKLLFQNKNF